MVEELVDVEALVRDALVLELPLQPLCEPDCPGLCSNAAPRWPRTRTTHHDSVDPRWAALGAWRSRASPPSGDFVTPADFR